MKTQTDASLALRTYQAGMLQGAAYRNLTAFLTRELSVVDLSVNEWSLLGLLASGKHRPSEIALEMGVSAPMVPRLMQALLVKELASETADDNDQRSKSIAITAKGRHLLDTNETRLRAKMREYLSDITLADLNKYVRVMAKIARKV